MIQTIIDIIKITYSPKFAMKRAKEFWSNTTTTHGTMNDDQFNFFYTELAKLIAPSQDESMLDYGGGNGEIAYRFKEDGFNISHCDLSPKMVKNAVEKFKLNSCQCEQIESGKYDIILFHNALFYVHPYLLKDFLQKMYDLLGKNGKLYVTDTPDYAKRKSLYDNKFKLLLTDLFPVYQPQMAGFFVKDNQLKLIAKEIGFTVSKKDSWAS